MFAHDMSQIRKFNIFPSGQNILQNKNTKSDKMIHTAIYIFNYK